MFKLKSVVGVVLILTLGYTALWYTVAFRTQKAITATLSAWLDEGMSVRHGDIALSGFPYRIVIDIENLQVATRRAGVEIEADTLTLISHLWTPQHWIAQASGFSASLADRMVHFEEDFVQASYRVHDGNKLVVKIDSADAGDMTLISPTPPPTLTKWTLMLGKDNGDAAATSGLYEKRTLEFKAFAETATSSLSVTGGVSGPAIADWTTADLSHWRDEGGVVTFDAIEWKVGSGTLSMNGDLTLDEAFRPLGSATLAAENWQQFEAPLRWLGFSPERGAQAPASAMIQNGSVVLDGAPLGSIGPVIGN